MKVAKFYILLIVLLPGCLDRGGEEEGHDPNQSGLIYSPPLPVFHVVTNVSVWWASYSMYRGGSISHVMKWIVEGGEIIFWHINWVDFWAAKEWLTYM